MSEAVEAGRNLEEAPRPGGFREPAGPAAVLPEPSGSGRRGPW